jgi:hypothetical protein
MARDEQWEEGEELAVKQIRAQVTFMELHEFLEAFRFIALYQREREWIACSDTLYCLHYSIVAWRPPTLVGNGSLTCSDNP